MNSSDHEELDVNDPVSQENDKTTEKEEEEGKEKVKVGENQI